MALIFLGVYVVASIVAMAAPTVDWLLAGRLLQGIGASAGIAVSRAIVRDRFTGHQSSRVMNAIGIAMAVGPAASPTLGGLILAALGWHAIFVFMAAYGVVLMALIAAYMPETLRDRDPTRFRPRRLLANYGAIIGDPRFLQPALVVGCTIGTLYASATMLPFVLIDRAGLSPVAFGIGMLAQSGSYIVGSFVTRLLMRRFDAAALVPFGIGFALAGGVLLAILLRVAEPTFLSVMGPIAFIAFGIALAQPAATTAALAPVPGDRRLGRRPSRFHADRRRPCRQPCRRPPPRAGPGACHGHSGDDADRRCGAVRPRPAQRQPGRRGARSGRIAAPARRA